MPIRPGKKPGLMDASADIPRNSLDFFGLLPFLGLALSAQSA